jgi:hypothetical protein
VTRKPARRVRKFAIVLLVLAAGLVAVACAETLAAPPKKPKPLRIAEPGALALAPDGALLVGDRRLRRVVRVDLRTKARRVLAAGFPEAIVGLGYDDSGRLHVSAGDRVYRLEGGRKVLVAGTGARGHSGDGGAAAAAQLAGAGGIDVDHDERIAIAEYDNWIRVVSPEGTISSVAGNGGTGYAGDGGAAVAALLGHPHDVIWRRDGVLLVADSHNGVIRKVDAAGTITTFASGFQAPVDLVGAPGDAVYVADGARGVYRLAPNGGAPRLVARVASAFAVAVDNAGNAYVSQLEARRVVKVTPGGRVSVLVPRSS